MVYLHPKTSVILLSSDLTWAYLINIIPDSTKLNISFFLSSFFFISKCYSHISIVHFVQKISLLISLETNFFINKFFCNSLAGFLLKYIIICLTMIFLNFCKGKYITLIKFVNFHTVISFKVVEINFRGLREHCHL